MIKPYLDELRQNRPLVHNIVSPVSSRIVASMLMALGVSPIMAEAKEEMADIARHAESVHLNLGMVTSEKEKAMIAAMKAYQDLNKPIVIDPVGYSGSEFRKAVFQHLLEAGTPSVICGNYSEIFAILGLTHASYGVDSLLNDYDESLIDDLLEKAKSIDSIFVLSGKTDLIISKSVCYAVKNGSFMMSQVSGTGCTLSGVIASLLAKSDDKAYLEKTLYATITMGVIGELSAEKKTPMAFAQDMVDRAYSLKDEEIRKRARYEKIR